MTAWDEANHYLVEKGPGMYLVQHVRDLQNANVIFCSDRELHTLKQLVILVDQSILPEFDLGNDVAVVVSNIRAALTPEE